MTKRIVEIRAIGRLWMPNASCTWTRSYTVGTGPFQHDLHTLDDCEQRMLTDSGDLSAIDDYEITYVITRTRRGTLSHETITHTRAKVARPWQDPDSEIAWIDATADVDA